MSGNGPGFGIQEIIIKKQEKEAKSKYEVKWASEVRKLQVAGKSPFRVDGRRSDFTDFKSFNLF